MKTWIEFELLFLLIGLLFFSLFFAIKLLPNFITELLVARYPRLLERIFRISGMSFFVFLVSVIAKKIYRWIMAL
jgi:hypothetical protein